jgi:eukaryotic-like serine/threonine-protein kinase
MAAMPLQDWNQIKQLFSAALSVPPQDRDAYLTSACEGKPELRLAVDELLRAHNDASHTFLEPSSIVLAASWLFREGDRVAARFRVTKRIARGAMGEVYQVYDERLRLSVALKAIRPELIGDAETVERFRREVLVTRDIAHDGLCRVFDLVEHTIGPQAGFPEGTIVPCLTMQLLEGETLEETLARDRPMAPEVALPLLEQIAEALQVLHDAGIVHRDLKPSNVMLVQTAEGTRAVLTDFGLAKPLEENIFETQTRVHGGAPFFMAPELFRGERPSRASDIYAFGLLVDEMVTSTRAFSGDSLHALLLQKLGDGPVMPSLRSTSIPPTWERAILRCLAKQPQDRFHSADAVLDALASSSAREQEWSGARRWLRKASAPRPLHLAYVAIGILVLSGVAAMEPLTNAPPTPVVIRPFANLTQRRELDYLAVGTPGELGRRLSRVPTVRVYTPTESNGKADPSRAGTFGVSGHIQEVNGLLRITVQLKDEAEQAVLWSQRFDGSLNQSLQIEDELAAETVGALSRLQPSRDPNTFRRLAGVFTSKFPWQRPSIPSSGTTNSAAFDDYLRGRTLFEERTIPSALQAIDYLKRAVKEDPNYAAAYATLADVQGVLMDLHYKPHGVLIQEAEGYIEQAVALDPDLPDVQLSLGAVRQMQWRWTDADAAYKRAIELHPTSARAHRWYSGLLLQFGRFDESVQMHRDAIALDPFDYPSQSTFGHTLFQAGRVKEAATHLETLLARKNLLYGHVLLGQIYACLSGSDPARATEYLNKALAESAFVRKNDAAAQGAPGEEPHSDSADVIAALAWSYQGKFEEAAPYLDRLLAARSRGRISSGMIARVYAVQRDSARAMEALLDAEAQHDRELYYINVSPTYAGIRNEPQFRALVDRMGLSH